MKKIILHIGVEKTGTTSIQSALAHDRDRLVTRGILYPRLFGSENHMEIPVHAMNDEINDELRQNELAKADCSLHDYRERLVERLGSEIAQSDCDTLLLSNEHCHSRLIAPGTLDRLKTLLDQFAPRVEIVVYLRRQDQLAVSLHSTRVKLGGHGPILPPVGEHGPGPYFNFRSLLRRYSHVFGQDAMRVRLFERDRLVGANVVTDFYHVAGLGLPAPDLPRANASLSARQNAFLERFNAIFPLMKDGRLNPMRGPIFDVVSNVCTGAPFRPARADAVAFYKHFREGNDFVKQHYFPDIDRETLFEEDFDSYPEHADGTALTEDDMFEFVTAIWTHARKLHRRP